MRVELVGDGVSERPSDICERCDRPRYEHAHGLCYWRDHGGGASFINSAAANAPQTSESANNAIVAERDAAIRELGEMSRRCGYAEALARELADVLRGWQHLPQENLSRRTGAVLKRAEEVGLQ